MRLEGNEMRSLNPRRGWGRVVLKFVAAATRSGGGFGPEGRKARGRENHGACALRASLPEAVGASSPRREGVKELAGL